MQLLRDMYPNTLFSRQFAAVLLMFHVDRFPAWRKCNSCAAEPQMLQQRALLGKLRKGALQLPNVVTSQHDFSIS